jgi:uncharacterized protein YjaG (DUF416 family)
MLELLREEKKSLLLSLSRTKKLAFLVLLYERMLPELFSYFLASERDFSLMQRASKTFWQFSSSNETSASWSELRETILDALPDMDDDGSLAAQFALNAGLVAADIAGLADDGQDSHVTEAIGYALASVYAKATIGTQIYVYSRAVEEAVIRHPLFQREREREEDDVAFLASLPEAPWPQNVVSMLRERAQAQEALLGASR